MLSTMTRPIELRLNFSETMKTGKQIRRYLSLTISTVPFSFLQGDLQVTALETSQRDYVVLVVFKESIIYQYKYNPQ